MTANPKVPVTQPSAAPEKTRERLRSYGFLLGAIFLHVVLFLLVATWIIFAPPAEPPDAIFAPVAIKPPPPPPPQPPANSGGGSQNPTEPQIQVTPPSNPVSIVHSIAPSNFNVETTKVNVPTLPDSFTEASGNSLGQNGSDGSGLGAGNPFGSGASDQVAFTGIFYDLKQSPDHVSTKMTADKEQALLKEFFAHGWSEAEFKRNYLNSRKPLFTNEFMIPFQYSTAGPAAFGLQKVSQPGFWAIVYHVTIKPTRTGDFCLAGFGDDFLVVRVNGTIVLDSGWFPPITDFVRDKTYPHGPWLNDRENRDSTTYGNANVGDKFHIDAGQDLTMDVLISDAYPAGGIGRIGYFLFLLEADKEYTTKDSQGNYVLPLLQLHPDPNVKRDGEYPPFTCNPGDALIGAQ